jgi:hypothetical protein
MAKRVTKTVEVEEKVTETISTARSVPDAGEAFVIGPSDGFFDRVGTVPVSLKRSLSQPTLDQPLWTAIRNRTKAIDFGNYKEFIDAVLCRYDETTTDKKLIRQIDELGSQVRGVGAYELLRTATETFLLLNCGVSIEGGGRTVDLEESNRLGFTVTLDELRSKLATYLGEGRLPYIRRVLDAAFPGLDEGDSVFCDSVITNFADGPCLLELIWSYWHEEGMLVQTLNAISLRFQNRRSNGSGNDPLAHLVLDPIRPLNNLLWGYIQDEQHRLTVQRRAYEYDHHYGLALVGKAVPTLKTVDSRSKFVEAFHNLLHTTSLFYTDDDDTTRLADAFPVLNALKETHLLLAQGAHNQFGDLPWTARVEMLIQEWLLARSEMRDFLQSRPMVPYQEGWMGQVDTMKKLQGWSDVTVTHFRDLGVFGEQLLLSVRYGDWIGVNDPAQAANWARYWRPEVQSYIHGYRAATGVDLTGETVDATMPSRLLQNRLTAQARVR